LILIGIPTVISVVGIIISVVPNNLARNSLIIFSFFALVALIIFITYYSRIEDDKELEIERIKKENQELKAVNEHLKLQNKSHMLMINTVSCFTEIWSKNINSFANDVKRKGTALEKYWDKRTLYDSICEKCRDTIEAYVGNDDSTRISVGFIEYTMDGKEEWISFIAHSNPESTKPSAYGKKEKLSECNYHYAQLIKDRYSDVEVACNNEEVLRIFNSINGNSDLSKYTQYIAIPVFCSQKKMLGILQIVTRKGYVIIENKDLLKTYAESNLMIYANLIVLIDKIGKGLYAKPMESGVGRNGKE
jgi:hypothetical protein